MQYFLDRERELRTLEQAWDAPRASLILLWGRRRTGKTSLLGRFCARRRHVFYGAAQESSQAELAAFSEAARMALNPAGGDLLAHAAFPDWRSAFEYLGARARRERLAVVLDEFPYLAHAEPALPSIIQRFWDHQGRTSKLKLILCGSAQSVMEELQKERAPLFGRVDVRLQLRPFTYREAGLFHPRLTPPERAVVYAVLGGMPAYLSRWRDNAGHRSNLRRLFADPASPLIEEGEFVLASELPEGSGYFRILHAISSGHRTYGAIRSFAGIEIQRQLEKVTELGLIDRVVPATEDPLRTKQVVYRIADNFLAFWFRFVYRHRADITRGLGSQVVDRAILPRLSDHMGEPWEEMCREFLRRRAVSGTLPVQVSSLGPWWSRDGSVEIDAVGVHGREVVLAGSVKWANRAGRTELHRLARAVEALPRRAPKVQLVLFAKQAVTGIAGAEALSFTAKDLYAD